MHKYTTFIVVLFVTENTQMSVNKGQVEKAMVYIHTMEYYATVQKKWGLQSLFIICASVVVNSCTSYSLLITPKSVEVALLWSLSAKYMQRYELSNVHVPSRGPNKATLTSLGSHSVNVTCVNKVFSAIIFTLLCLLMVISLFKRVPSIILKCYQEVLSKGKLWCSWQKWSRCEEIFTYLY